MLTRTQERRTGGIQRASGRGIVPARRKISAPHKAKARPPVAMIEPPRMYRSGSAKGINVHLAGRKRVTFSPISGRGSRRGKGDLFTVQLMCE